MKTKVVNMVIILIILAITLVAIAYLPDTVPVHFDAYGNTDREGSKYELLILPASLLLVWILGDKGVKFFTKNTNSDDEKQENDAKVNEKTVDKTLTITCAVMAVINLGIIYTTFSKLDSYSLPEIDIIKIVTILLGLMFVGVGNFMPRTRTNSLIGFRCKWTMYNENSWRKSNLFAGIVMMVLGILIALENIIFSGIVAAMIMIGLLIVSIVIMSVYAYVVYKKEKNNDCLSQG